MFHFRKRHIRTCRTHGIHRCIHLHVEHTYNILGHSVGTELHLITFIYKFNISRTSPNIFRCIKQHDDYLTDIFDDLQSIWMVLINVHKNGEIIVPLDLFVKNDIVGQNISNIFPKIKFNRDFSAMKSHNNFQINSFIFKGLFKHQTLLRFAFIATK